MSAYRKERKNTCVRHCTFGLSTDGRKVGNAILDLEASTFGEGNGDVRGCRDCGSESQEGRCEEEKRRKVHGGHRRKWEGKFERMTLSR